MLEKFVVKGKCYHCGFKGSVIEVRDHELWRESDSTLGIIGLCQECIYNVFCRNESIEEDKKQERDGIGNKNTLIAKNNTIYSCCCDFGLSSQVTLLPGADGYVGILDILVENDMAYNKAAAEKLVQRNVVTVHEGRSICHPIVGVGYRRGRQIGIKIGSEPIKGITV